MLPRFLCCIGLSALSVAQVLLAFRSMTSEIQLVHYLKKLLISISILFVSLHALAGSEPLAIPKMEPNLGVSSEKTLGTLDKGAGFAVGHVVNNFSIKDHLGKPFDFKASLKNSHALVIFYRGGWCPYCNVQIRQLVEAWPEFKKRKVTPILISVDKPDGAALAQKQYEIPFPVLSDTEAYAHESFNVVHYVDDKTLAKLKSYDIDIEAWSGKKHHKIAVPGVFLVDQKGVIRWAHSSRDYKVRPSVEQLLKSIDSIKL